MVCQFQCSHGASAERHDKDAMPVTNSRIQMRIVSPPGRLWPADSASPASGPVIVMVTVTNGPCQ